MSNEIDSYKADFINTEKINTILENAKSMTNEEFDAIITKAENAYGLEDVEVAKLLNVEDDAKLSRIFEAAHKIKEKIYGKRVVIFAPALCKQLLCKQLQILRLFPTTVKCFRKKLTKEEVIEEIKNIGINGPQEACIRKLAKTQ